MISDLCANIINYDKRVVIFVEFYLAQAETALRYARTFLATFQLNLTNLIDKSNYTNVVKLYFSLFYATRNVFTSKTITL